MSRISALGDSHVDQWAALNPTSATLRGIAGHDAEMTDFSPEGAAARAALDRETLTALAGMPAEDEGDRLAAAVMRDQLEAQLEQYEAGEQRRSLSAISSPFQNIRSCFDSMPKESAADWETVAVRLALVPRALQSYRRTIEEGLALGHTIPPRLVAECIGRAELWGGLQSGTAPYFMALVGGCTAGSGALQQALAEGAHAATRAYADFAAFLRDEYAPRITAPDAAGPERYALCSRAHLGVALDLQEAYAWAWDELHAAERELDRLAEQITPGAGLDAVIAALNADPAYAPGGAEPYRAWVEEQQHAALASLDGVHFDIPEPLKRLDVLLAPPGSSAGAGAYYRGPSEDLSRPGSIWLAAEEHMRTPRWRFLATCYHEGVPGHHLQIGQVRCLRDRLSRFQRLIVSTAGHVEGWAMYAERLVRDLGYYETPLLQLGALLSEPTVCVAVIVDIGLHLGLAIPGDEWFHPGERFTPALAEAFIAARRRVPQAMAVSLTTRSLGNPGQWTAYKLGERVWLQCRRGAEQRQGQAFDPKFFHTHALSLGPMGLGRLREELAGR